MGDKGLSASDWGVCVHYRVAGDPVAAIVYTDGRIGALCASFGRLCTLLCCGRPRVAAIVYTDGMIGALCASLGRLCTLLNCGLGLWVALGSQECTQMGGSGLSTPDWGVCVHCWAVSCGQPPAGLLSVGVAEPLERGKVVAALRKPG